MRVALAATPLDAPLRQALEDRVRVLEWDEARRKPGSSRLRSLEDKLAASTAAEEAASQAVEEALQNQEHCRARKVSVERELEALREELAVPGGTAFKTSEELRALASIEGKLEVILNSKDVPEAKAYLAELAVQVAGWKKVANQRAASSSSWSTASALPPAGDAGTPPRLPPFSLRAGKLRTRIRGKQSPAPASASPTRVRRRGKLDVVTAAEMAERKAEIAEKRRTNVARARTFREKVGNELEGMEDL